MSVQRTAALIAAVYEFNCVGGNCHIVLDDYNIDDSSIHWCLNTAIPENSHKHTIAQLEIENACLMAMLELSEEEREAAIYLKDGWR